MIVGIEALLVGRAACLVEVVAFSLSDLDVEAAVDDIAGFVVGWA